MSGLGTFSFLLNEHERDVNLKEKEKSYETNYLFFLIVRNISFISVPIINITFAVTSCSYNQCIENLKNNLFKESGNKMKKNSAPLYNPLM